MRARTVVRTALISFSLMASLLLLCAFAAAQTPAPAPASNTAPAVPATFTADRTTTAALRTKSVYQNAITVKAQDGDGKPLAGVVFEAFVKAGGLSLFTDQDATLTNHLSNLKTDAQGTSTFSIMTGDKTDASILVVPHAADNTLDVLKGVVLPLTLTAATPAAAAPPPEAAAAPIKYTVGEAPKLKPNANQIDAITITAKVGDQPKPGVKINAKIVGTDVNLFTDKLPQARTSHAETDATGVAKFSIATTSDHPGNSELQLMPLNADGSVDGANIQHVTLTAQPTHLQSLGSKLAYLQLFTGTTFANNYNSTGKNTGFGSGGQIIRMTFDTMWKHQRTLNPTPSICSDNSVKAEDKKAAGCDSFPAPSDICSNPKKTAEEKQAAGCDRYPTICRNRAASLEARANANCEIVPNPHGWSDGAWHTDLNIEFSKFPFSTLEPKKDDKGQIIRDIKDQPIMEVVFGPLENAFTGSVGATWQPNRWSHYDRRDEDALAGKFDEMPYDAFRWELFGKAGVTTLAQSRVSGDTNTDRIQLGVRFTHRRSFKADASQEDRNLEPIRFIEISGVMFSNWQGKRAVPRVIIDGGLRLGALSNDVFPVYVGAHLNSGPGPDDLRVFLGVLMKLDKLANIVRNAGVPTGD
jgi:hypothetical protein